MSEAEVTVAHGLPDELREQAVAVFEEAFGEKMRTALPDQGARTAFMRRACRADNAVVARQGDRLLGMAGLASRGAPYDGGPLGRSWDPRPYRDLLGWLGAIWAIWGLRLSDHTPEPDEIYVDGIAVAAEARGLGIGTRLLAEIDDIARSHGKRYVRLDVVDSNPRAQALYERVGYRVTKVHPFGWKRRWVGFGAMISMERRVVPGTTEVMT